MIRKLLKPIASLKLTVVIFALSMFLIFAGTLAQVHAGIWTVVNEYFRSAVVTIDLQIFVPVKVARIPGAIWFPGGLTLGVAMFVNLIAAHAVRFKFKKKRIGIILTHLGVMLLLVGEFVTGFAAEEGNMTIREGETVNFVESNRSSEFVVVDQSKHDIDTVVAVPAKILSSAKGKVSDSQLPFSIEVDEWMSNSQLRGPNEDQGGNRGKADSGAANSLAAILIAPSSGVGSGAGSIDVPSAYITLYTGEERLGTYLVSSYLRESQVVFVEGKAYWISLRFKRTYKPYAIRLIDFKHDLFTGTQMARNYSSDVQLVDTNRNVDREVHIYMNHPMRHAGETFYQASFLQGDTGTILQVVKNPGWLIPYISCSLVTLGMLLHFGIRLIPTLKGRSS